MNSSLNIMNNQNKKNKYYITTPIYYINERPHLGHAYSSVIADVLARYNKNLGKEVFFLTGTDEHGRKIIQAAEKTGLPPQEFADKYSAYFKEILPLLNIENSYFIRTTDKEIHWPKAIELWQKIKSAGDIYKGSYKGLYCVGHEAFLKPSELKNGICPDHQTKPEIIEEENYFFKLSRYQNILKSKIENDEIKILPTTRKNEILSFLNEGLEDISFSRPAKDLNWGIPVPGDATQTIYVWADALANYISGLKNDFDKFFPPDTQIIGKDILRFHAVIWPAILLSAKLPLPKTIFIHGYITINGQKMSKTIGNIIDPVEIINKYGIDPLRYYLLREIVPSQDGDFSYEKLKKRYDSDLVNGLSNTIHRILILAWQNKKMFNEREKISTAERQIIRKKYDQAILNFEFNEALKIIWELISHIDKKIEKEKLWELPQKNQKKFSEIIKNTLNDFYLIADLLKPFLPLTGEKILELIKLENKPEPIFKKL